MRNAGTRPRLSVLCRGLMDIGEEIPGRRGPGIGQLILRQLKEFVIKGREEAHHHVVDLLVHQLVPNQSPHHELILPGVLVALAGLAAAVRAVRLPVVGIRLIRGSGHAGRSFEFNRLKG